MSNVPAKFEGKPVEGTSLSLSLTGNPIQDAVALDPAAYKVGDIIDVVCRARVTHVDHVEIKDTNALTRAHKAKGLTIKVVNKDNTTADERNVVDDVIRRQADAVDKLHEPDDV